MAIRSYSATVPIFFYIGDLPKAMKKLSQSLLNINTISIGDNPKSIESFLKANLTDALWLFFIQYNKNKSIELFLPWEDDALGLVAWYYHVLAFLMDSESFQLLEFIQINFF